MHQHTDEKLILKHNCFQKRSCYVTSTTPPTPVNLTILLVCTYQIWDLLLMDVMLHFSYIYHTPQTGRIDITILVFQPVSEFGKIDCGNCCVIHPEQCLPINSNRNSALGKPTVIVLVFNKQLIFSEVGLSENDMNIYHLTCYRWLWNDLA